MTGQPQQAKLAKGSSERPIITIADAMGSFLDMVALSRSRHTVLAYRNALRVLREVLKQNSQEADSTPADRLSEDLIQPMASYLRVYSLATEGLYLHAVKQFLEFVDAERLADINQSRVRVLIRQRARRAGVRFPQFPTDQIERLLAQIENLESLAIPTIGEQPQAAKLRARRDRAFLLTLADTGLRVHEACRLTRGDMNWNEGYAIIIGKGDKQALVRFTSRAIEAIQAYLSARATLDGGSGRQLTSLPLFARHDRGTGRKVRPITPTTGRNIVRERVSQLLGDEFVGSITPHSFRHYFVTSVLRGTGNLRYAQELARHTNIQVTQRYTHLSNDELDRAYYEVFERKSRGQAGAETKIDPAGEKQD